MNIQNIPNKPLNMTEVLNHVKEHLLSQNERSIFDGICQYRSSDKSCAVGCLIPNSIYNGKWEGKGITTLIHDDLLVFKHFMGKVIDFELPNMRKLLEALQVIHDSYNVEKWPVMLDNLNGCETWDNNTWMNFFVNYIDTAVQPFEPVNPPIIIEE